MQYSAARARYRKEQGFTRDHTTWREKKNSRNNKMNVDAG